MARLLPEDFRPEDLNIEIKVEFPNCTEVFYLPSFDELKEARLDTSSPSQYKIRVALFNGQNGFISIFPIFTLPTHPNYLKQKYEQIDAISVTADFDSAPNTKDEVVTLLQLLPSGFIKDIRYGLGLKKEYHPIISAIEGHTEHHCLAISEKKNR